MMNREQMLQRAVDRDEPWDMLIIGGGDGGQTEQGRSELREQIINK